MIEDINFIKTDKEGVELQAIKEFYPNSFIDVNSHSEKNIYIGSERVTDNYNLGVDEGSITNNVGGMTSGIYASELKGKSVSEILDIILFASNNNMTLKGVMVVDKIENLTDTTLEEVYQGMVVSVVEDNSLYILLTDTNSEREWKKVGSDINIEEIKTSVKKLSAPIIVAGLSSDLGNISNGKTYTTDNTIEDILRDILCKEIYPNVSLSETNPSLSFGGIKIDNSDSNYQSLMEVGSVLNLGSVTLNSASISNGHRVGSGFIYGYSFTNDGKKDGDNNPPKVDAEKSLDGNYSLVETYSPSTIGSVRTSTPSVKYSDVKFAAGSVKIALGSNTIFITAKSPSGKYTHPEYPEYYVVSNLGNTNTNEKLDKSSKVERTLNLITDTETITVKGVYPVYVNINTETNKLVNEPIKMDLTDSNVIIFDNVPSEVDSQEHFKFDYPATHSVVSFEATDVQGNFVNYDASHEKESNETITKVICGENVSYKRLQTTGKLQGEGTYKITLSKSLDKIK
jgi:hypothetical protein